MTQPSTGSAVGKPKASVLERMLAVAQSPEERLKAYQVAERLEVQQLVAEVKAKSWGDKVSPLLRAEIVKWSLLQGADPVEEVDVLGGSPYLNAKYWMRLVAAEPDFDHVVETQLADHPDDGEDVREEKKKLRSMWNVPTEFPATIGLHRDQREAAKSRPPIKVLSATLIALHFKGRGPFYGVKWAPSSAVDSIGVDFHEQTARTRAFRKAALQAVRRKTPLTERLKSLRESQDLGGQTTLPSKDAAAVSLAEPEAIEIAPLPANAPAPKVDPI